MTPARPFAVARLILALGVLLMPLAAGAQPARPVPRIGVIHFGNPGSTEVEAFRQGLREVGRVEGQNLAVEYRYAAGKTERYGDLVTELLALKVDVLVVAATGLAQVAKRLTTTTPVVFMFADQPVALGLVQSLGRPGGNVTGLVTLNAELSAKRLELLKETLPRVRRVAVLVEPYPLTTLALEEAQAAARVLGLQLQPVEIRGGDDLDGAFAEMTRQRAEALLRLPGVLTGAHSARILDLALKHRLPVVWDPSWVRAGGFLGYSANSDDLSRRAATFVDKILKGTTPADLPVEQPTRFELAVNLKTARAIGVTVPQAILQRADEVIR